MEVFFMKKYIIPAEVYSRVSGYFRPVAQWNNGKREEFTERKMLDFDNNTITEADLKFKKR
jgi:ribonucleoside-triphosphate reductase (formate)